jgi:hypothetical protein
MRRYVSIGPAGPAIVRWVGILRDCRFAGVCANRLKRSVSMEEIKDVAGNQESRNMALLIWIGTIFFGFIPGLIFYLIKKDDAYVFDQAKESLNWSITAAIAMVVGGFLTVILVGFLVMPAVWVCNLVFCIMGAMACSNGKDFRVPWTLRLIK